MLEIDLQLYDQKAKATVQKALQKAEEKHNMKVGKEANNNASSKETAVNPDDPLDFWISQVFQFYH